MRASHRLSLIVALTVGPACQAFAQASWPGEGPKTGQSAWPGAGGPAPAPMMGAPAAPPPGGFSGGPPPGGFGGGPPPGMGGPPGAGPTAAQQACFAEFTKLREDVEKKGKAARAGGEHKISREEMCKLITAFTTAEMKWIKFSEAGVNTCGIPAQIIQQLKTAHHNSDQTREKICAAPPAPPAPSLSDALGTTRLPTPETTRTGSGTLDTLTGNAIQR